MAKTSAKTTTAKVGKAYQILPVVGPSAGVDLRTSPTLLASDRASKLVNFSLAEPGALVVRAGFVQFSTTGVGSGVFQGGARVYLNTAIPAAASTAFTLVGESQSIVSISDSGAWSAALLSGLSTNQFSIVSDRDQVAVFDGASTRISKSTNGSSWTRFGIAPGSAGPAVSTGTSGTVSSGEFQFGYTYKDRDLAYESNGSSNYSTLTATDTGIINAVVPNSTDPQVDAIVLYGRKVSAGETVLRKISSQAQSAGTHSTIAVTSTAWTQNAEIPTDHNVPPVLSFGVVWKNRWWARSATVTNRLHFTQLFLPQAWPALFYIDIPFERGDGIQAIVPLGDTLLIFGSTKIYIILGQTSLDFEVRPTIASEDGALGFRACAAIENGVVHVGSAGIYIFDGSTDKLLSHDLEPAWRDLIGNASVSELQKIAVVYHSRQKELRITVPRRYPSGTYGEWILDLNRTRTTSQPAWTATDRAIGGYISWDGPETNTGDRGRLFSWHTVNGRLYEESVGTSAAGADITAEYEGPGLTLGAHRARWVDLRGEYEPHGGTVAVEPVIDGVSQGSQTVNIGAGLSVYGSGLYGSAAYAGAGRRQFYVMLPLGADGRTFVLKVQYVGQEQWKLYTYHPGLVPETASRSFTE